MLIFKICIYTILLAVAFVCQRKKKRWKEELVFEEIFEKYLSEAAVVYGKTQNMEEALWELEMEQKLVLPKGNPFVRMFDAMCTLVKSEGDIRHDGTSVFLMNLQYLKEELRGHLLLYRERKYLFLGLDYLSLLPVFFLPLVELWAGTTSENMMHYYKGGYGMLALFMVFLMTLFTYLLVLWLLLPQMAVERQYVFAKKLLKWKRLSGWIDRYINRRYTVCLKKNEYLKELQGYGNIREFLAGKLGWGVLGAVCAILLLAGCVVPEGLRWYQFLLILPAAVMAAQIPELFLVIEKWKSRDKRMEEALRMQTITLLLVHYEETTVEEILMRMEEFAEVFAPALAKAVDTFSYRRIQTLNTLKEDITDEGMRRISDTLLFCEELPLEEAFANLEGERAYFLKRNQEERKNNQREYAALARAAAYLPLFAMILLELVIPFVAEGLSELAAYSEGLTGMF